MTRLFVEPSFGRIVLAYSGSVSGAVAIGWLRARYGAEVVTLTLDLGQQASLEAVRDRALAAGAARAHVIDAREEFAQDIIVPALRAGAVRVDGDPLVTALSRPVIAKHLVELARLEDAAAVAHGCPAWADEDAQRFEALVGALDPSLVVLAPVRDWRLSAAEISDRARACGIPSSVRGRAAVDVDANLWGRVASASEPAPGAATYVLTRPSAAAPDAPANVEVSFEEGVPVAINGVALPIVELISSIETIAGSHGVGRLAARDAVSSADLTIEAPAAVVLYEAHRALQQSVMPPDLDRDTRDHSEAYIDLVRTGGWYTSRRQDGDRFAADIQKHVTGTARLTLFKGRSEVVECRSPFARREAPPTAPATIAASRS